MRLCEMAENKHLQTIWPYVSVLSHALIISSQLLKPTYTDCIGCSQMIERTSAYPLQ